MGCHLIWVSARWILDVKINLRVTMVPKELRLRVSLHPLPGIASLTNTPYVKACFQDPHTLSFS